MASLLGAIYGYFLAPVLTLLIWMLIINAILSWLIVFNVVNVRQPVVQMFLRFSGALTEPLMAPFRKLIPPINGVDLAPFALILTLFFTRDYALPALIGLIAA